MTADADAGGAGQLLGRFAAGHDRHREVEDGTRARAAEVLLDCLGVMLAGAREPVADAVVDPVPDGRPEATVVGRAARVGAPAAALANGTAAHALDYDDVQQPWYGHPTAVLLPAALAVAERGGLSGHDLVTGYLLGLAVGDALGAALNTGHYDRGWHPTSTLGTVAAAATCAFLTGAPADQVTSALGIAASAAGGLRENFGSDVKAVHAGLAARNGVVAAWMAERGVRASASALDGTHGFAAVLGGGHLDAEALEARLAEGLSPPLDRVGLKRYPACAATGPAVDAVLELRERHGIDPADVRRVDCVIEPLATSLLTFPRPRTSQEARFSLQHCVAAALVDGTLGLEQLEAGRVADPTVRRLGEAVHLVTDDSIAPTGDFPSTVTIALQDGREVTAHVAQAIGKPRNPMGRAAVVGKFHATVSAAGYGHELSAVAAQLLHVDDCADVREWTAALRRAAAPTPAG